MTRFSGYEVVKSLFFLLQVKIYITLFGITRCVCVTHDHTKFCFTGHIFCASSSSEHLSGLVKLSSSIFSYAPQPSAILPNPQLILPNPHFLSRKQNLPKSLKTPSNRGTLQPDHSIPHIRIFPQLSPFQGLNRACISVDVPYYLKASRFPSNRILIS